ncbi:hypothetical protein BDV96DRAFT_567549 [Lophiotrema nucula]|uniref:F-box domain-containing protein n=1 Tax=Lophiotrema nucula TaxID=690887 RepID=A0A6A5ZK96_9PLEO|nr:hypothetical protein BDV96DRAFT_567549 [Lophiotrema nucula]
MALALLPEELIESIAIDLPIEDFRSFRLVSTALEQRSRHGFRERFFRKRTLRWHTESFRDLLDITISALFGNVLQDLVIDATPRYAIQQWRIRKQIAEDQCDPELKDLYMIEQEDIKKRTGESAKFWNESRYDRKSLIVVFEKLRKLRSITFAYDGMDRIYGTFGRRYCESSQNEMSRPFVSTMDAISVSGMLVEEISMDTSRHHGAVSIGRLESLARSLLNFEVSFEHLRVLQLNLRDWRYLEEGFEQPPERLSFAVRFLSKCTSVRELGLSCFSSLEGDIFNQLTRNCQFSHLETCTLELFRLSAADFFHFFMASQRSLRRLSLSHIVLRDDTIIWSDLMRYLADNFALESLNMRSMFTRPGARIGIDGTVKGAIILEGRELAEQLRYHADHLINGNWGPAWHLASVAYPFIGIRT